LPFYKKCQ